MFLSRIKVGKYFSNSQRSGQVEQKNEQVETKQEQMFHFEKVSS